MRIFNADLHIHSPHSIGVSQSLNLDSMVHTCKLKGLHILGTGDVFQPDWMQYLQSNLKKLPNSVFEYKGINFILQTEIEDDESIHQVIYFPDFDSVKELQKKLKPSSKNILGEWGGRPRINLSPEHIAEIVYDFGAILGPAHAFTPFKAIFRQNKFKTLEECYKSAVNKVYFLELGLSANTDLADRLKSLKQVSFLSNSDAHSESPRSLGREFNQIDMEEPSFEELLLAIRGKDRRKIVRNVGLHPKLGKYYTMFCNKCRRRVLFKKSKKQVSDIFSQYNVTDNFIIFYSNQPRETRKNSIAHISKQKMICPACRDKLQKNYKIKLGVSERIEVIADYSEPDRPVNRAPYFNAIPLYDIIRSIKNIKSTTSKTIDKIYNDIINKLGTEYEILLEMPIETIGEVHPELSELVKAMRAELIEYTPGGGGSYGNINFDF